MQPFAVEQRFPGLRSITIALYVVGFVLLIGSIVLGVAISSLARDDSQRLLSVVAGVVIGLAQFVALVAIAEVIGVVLAIEQNSRTTYLYVYQGLRELHDIIRTAAPQTIEP